MKTTVEEKHKDLGLKFPCLMKDRYGTLVVYFINNKQGFCVFPDNVYNFGDVDDWFIDCFELFDGTITLENVKL